MDFEPDANRLSVRMCIRVRLIWASVRMYLTRTMVPISTVLRVQRAELSVWLSGPMFKEKGRMYPVRISIRMYLTKNDIQGECLQGTGEMAQVKGKY